MMDQNADGLVDVADLVALHGIMGIEANLRHSKQLDRQTDRQTNRQTDRQTVTIIQNYLTDSACACAFLLRFDRIFFL